jgi:hypothetical protein
MLQLKTEFILVAGKRDQNLKISCLFYHGNEQNENIIKKAFDFLFYCYAV